MSIDTLSKEKVTIKQAIDDFFLSCKVEGKSYGTIECYQDKLKGFLWYCENYDIPSCIDEVTTQHLREFLAYLRDTGIGLIVTVLEPRNLSIQLQYRNTIELYLPL
jgi:site-specific recombinase XerD